MNQRIISPGPQDEEKVSEGSLRPRMLDEYIGQGKVVENLRVLVEAARTREEPLDHLLLYGPPGLGKTTLAHVVANEMQVSIKITSGPAIERPGDLAAILTNLRQGDILFIDEIHRLGKVVEEVLYPAMEDFALDIVIGKGPAARSIRLSLPRSVLWAPPPLDWFSAPLRSRFGAVAAPRLSMTHLPCGRSSGARRHHARGTTKRAWRDRPAVAGHARGGEPPVATGV